MLNDKSNQMVYLMDFVQDFLREKNYQMIQQPIHRSHPPLDALIASTVEALCINENIDQPEWVSKIPSVKEPYFVSGVESLKAIALVESPLSFRRRNVFVLENFLTRV